MEQGVISSTLIMSTKKTCTSLTFGNLLNGRLNVNSDIPVYYESHLARPFSFKETPFDFYFSNYKTLMINLRRYQTLKGGLFGNHGNS